MASELQVTTLRGVPTGANANQILVAAGQTLAAPGHIIQVVQAQYSGYQTISGTSYQTITGLQPTITPKYANSKILIQICLHFGESSDAFPAFNVFRNTVHVGPGDVGPSSSNQRNSFTHVGTENSGRDQYRITNVNWNYLDTPNTTDALNYRIDVSPMRTNSRTIYINRHEQMGDSNRSVTTSTFTLMEIAQ